MKSSEKNIKNLDLAFDSLFDSFENDYENDAKVIASKILSDISVITDKKDLNRKDVAALIGTSASYMTQLYRGSKILNFITLAKLKNKLNLKIEVKITENDYDESCDSFNYQNIVKEVNEGSVPKKWVVLKNRRYASDDDFSGSIGKPLKLIKQQLTA
jgi:hypothetical protein